MRILVLLHGWYGERIARNVAMRAPEWSVKTARLPTKLPAVVEDVEEEARKVLGQVDVTPDLVLFLSEEAAAAQLLPFIAERLEVGSWASTRCFLGLSAPSLVGGTRLLGVSPLSLGRRGFASGFQAALLGRWRCLGAPHAAPRTTSGVAREGPPNRGGDDTPIRVDGEKSG